MAQHLKVLGILTMIYHGLAILLVLVILPVMIGGSLLIDNPAAAGAVGGMGTIITIVILAITLPGIIGGIGLLQGRPWSRILVMVVNTISILSFPLGTALAIYSFWVLTKEESIELLQD